MSTIHPRYPQTPPPQPQQGQRLSGQSALFALARGKPAETTAATPQPAPVNRVAETTAEKPEKILRPGSLLDIRI